MNATLTSIPTITIEALIDDAQLDDGTSPMSLLAEAEIILGQDKLTQQVFIVDGQVALLDVIHDLDHAPVNVLVVELNRATDDVRQLRWLIDLAKCR